MNNLLNINYDNDRITISARELHKQLGIEKRFSVWFETNSKGFEENEDFCGACLKVQGNQYGGEQELRDYQLTIDMAKHICMMSRTEKGKEYRSWLIQLEKDWNSPDKIMARALLLANRKIEERDKQIEVMKPKALFADAVSASKTSILIGDLAKLIKQNGHDIGQRRLFQWMRDKGYLIKQQGASWNMPTQKAMDMGLFEIKETTITHSDGHISISKTVKVSGKGQIYFVNKFIAKP